MSRVLSTKWIAGVGLALGLAGCASTNGLDGPNIAYECQLQARDAANQPPFPDKIRDGKHGQAFEQGVRDAHMTQACQRDTESHAEIRFGNKPGT
ncbi:hypothetical protein [Pseudoxanthomonas winnipegensis]|uniref:Lipoprotein n=1 Tax=Pseudoxanthomonas winnipegensis TaxID=2480810 RepID=A0A4Q8LXG5_9GAMM|nr:hypothetical protein [Pseudoxanthomonas winnipegensis]RZZ90739.1 hypothetical protein EA663_03040 [Pseudoxanthomonas winnipegensis]TAA37106.1 hypothetical protein EA656_00010 [Pseudoxanthomonas winnipegensis]